MDHERLEVTQIPSESHGRPYSIGRMPMSLNLGTLHRAVDIAPAGEYDPPPDPEWRSRLAQHKSAAKRARQAVERTGRNRSVRSRVKTGIKKFQAALERGDAEQTSAALRAAEGLLSRAASKGVIPRKRAQRQVSRLAKQAHQAGS
jgi:small subunit ribosomal protein S20